MKWTVLSDNRSCNPALETEHGLSILLTTERHNILLDTGASDLFIRNAELLGVNLSDVELDGKPVSVQDKTPWATVIADYKKSLEG